MGYMFYILGGYSEFTSPPSAEMVQRVLDAGGVFVPQRPAPGYEWTNDEWVASVPQAGELAEAVNAERDRRMDALVDGYTETERETWHVQVREAWALAADPEAQAPMLRGIAARRGVSVLELTQHVLGLAADYAAKTGALMGAAGALRGMDPLPEDWADDRWW